MTYKIIPCENGVGEWEVVGEDIATQVFDLRSEAEEYLTHLKSRKSKMTKFMREQPKLNCCDFVLIDTDSGERVESLNYIYHYSTVIELLQNREENPLKRLSWSFVSMTELPEKLQKLYLEYLGAK